MPSQGCFFKRFARPRALRISNAWPLLTFPISSQRRGIATGTPGRARSEKKATAVAPRPFHHIGPRHVVAGIQIEMELHHENRPLALGQYLPGFGLTGLAELTLASVFGKAHLRFWSPRSPCPDLTMAFAFLARSCFNDLPTSSCFRIGLPRRGGHSGCRLRAV